MLLDIAGKRLDVVMDERVLQLSSFSLDHDMLMYLHIGHRSILVLEAAFESAFATAKQRELPESGAAVTQKPSQEIHAQRNVVAVAVRILNGPANLLDQFRSEGLVGINQENPVKRERERIHRPLALLGPSTLIAKLNYFSAERTGDLGSRITAA